MRFAGNFAGSGQGSIICDAEEKLSSTVGKVAIGFGSVMD
jgi:hypothetical protein